MKITIIGSGYVGLVTGACFAEMGNTVICADIDDVKISKLKNGIIPIYEPGLEHLIVSNERKKTLSFTTDIQSAITAGEVISIAVGTPQGEDGSADLKHVLSVAGDIGKYLNGYKLVIDKSTVPVGTAEKVRLEILSQLQRRGVDFEFDVVSNPEFLKEGAALEDFLKPDRVVVGAENGRAMEIMHELYRPFTLSHGRFVEMDIRSAEMTKYAANAMLATKISFINEIANICERVGADVNKVRQGIGSDSRIGFSFIYPGIGYGGSCFPKDIQALAKTAAENGYDPQLIHAVQNVNQKQRERFVQKVLSYFSDKVTGKTIGVWGLSFKPETDDMREAPSVPVIKALVSAGAKVRAYDPQAIEEAKSHFRGLSEIIYTKNKYDAADDANALLLITEWKEFRSPDFEELRKRMKSPVIFDGRNQYSVPTLTNNGFTYFQVGVSPAV